METERLSPLQGANPVQSLLPNDEAGRDNNNNAPVPPAAGDEVQAAAQARFQRSRQTMIFTHIDSQAIPWTARIYAWFQSFFSSKTSIEKLNEATGHAVKKATELNHYFLDTFSLDYRKAHADQWVMLEKPPFDVETAAGNREQLSEELRHVNGQLTTLDRLQSEVSYFAIHSPQLDSVTEDLRKQKRLLEQLLDAAKDSEPNVSLLIQQDLAKTDPEKYGKMILTRFSREYDRAFANHVGEHSNPRQILLVRNLYSPEFLYRTLRQIGHGASQAKYLVGSILGYLERNKSFGKMKQEFNRHFEILFARALGGDEADVTLIWSKEREGVNDPVKLHATDERAAQLIRIDRTALYLQDPISSRLRLMLQTNIAAQRITGQDAATRVSGYLNTEIAVLESLAKEGQAFVTELADVNALADSDQLIEQLQPALGRGERKAFAKALQSPQIQGELAAVRRRYQQLLDDGLTQQAVSVEPAPLGSGENPVLTPQQLEESLYRRGASQLPAEIEVELD